MAEVTEEITEDLKPSPLTKRIIKGIREKWKTSSEETVTITPKSLELDLQKVKSSKKSYPDTFKGFYWSVLRHTAIIFHNLWGGGI